MDGRVGDPRNRRRAATFAAGTALLGVVGCGGHSTAQAQQSPPALSAPSTAVSSSDPTAVGQRALDAYRGMWHAYGQAVLVPDPSSPDLARYATGAALTNLTQGLKSLKDQGLKGTGTFTVSPKITAVSPANAPTNIEITDCLDSSQSHIVRASTGPAYSDTPGGHRRVTASVEKEGDGSWRVTDFGAQAVGTC